jgi:farnesyl diphosphate synthase
MHPDLAFPVWTGERQRRIEDVLERALPSVEPGRTGTPTGTLDGAARLHEAMRHAVLGGGKRVRPLLAYAAGEFAQADPDVVDSAAAAVELIHAYSLVHDDLPSMDNDTLRRGKPTCHVAFGEATALLAGDALQSLAFGVLGKSRMRASGAACAMLAAAAGAPGMAGGQAIDLASTGVALSLPELQTMHRMKTGALIRAAVQLGAACGRPLTPEESCALDTFSEASGLAFQVIDDVLDVEGSDAALGKTAGKDAAQNKPTYVSLLGLAEARRHAEALRARAGAALAPFRGAARRLIELADWIVLRSH